MSGVLSNWLVRIAHATGLSRWLQHMPAIYRPLRAALLSTADAGGVREIVAGPLRGYRMVLGADDRNAYLVNAHEREIVDLAGRLCQPGMSVLDIGAHVGYFSLLFAVKAGPSGRVVVLEPNPANVAKIRSMLEINQMKNVELFPVAASDAGGVVRFVTEATGQMGHLAALDPSDTGSGEVAVDAVRLDDMAHSWKLDRVDLIKMDVEGAEERALTGMAKLLDRCRPTVICEWHPARAGADYAGAFERLGYRCELLEPASATEPFHVLARPAAAV